MRAKLFALALSLTATPTLASDFKKIDKRDFITLNDSTLDDRGRGNEAELKRRIERLERAVRQLQDYSFILSERVNYLESRPVERPEASNAYACFLKTAFHGAFFANAPTRLEATAKTLKQCEKAGESFCRKEQVECERAN